MRPKSRVADFYGWLWGQVFLVEPSYLWLSRNLSRARFWCRSRADGERTFGRLLGCNYGASSEGQSRAGAEIF
jgi:hypothetical protein